MTGTRRTMPKETDIAIVGGGVAGLYAAWRLATMAGQSLIPNRGDRLRIQVFEKAPEPGARLLSEEIPGLAFRAELGAMRYTSAQIIISRLIDKLGLHYRKFDVENTDLYLRGQYCRTRPNAYDPVPFDLDPTLRNKKAHQLVQIAILRALLEVEFDHELSETSELCRKIREKCFHLAKECGSDSWKGLDITLLTPREWELVKRFASLQEKPLKDIGFWNLLHYYLKGEGFLFVHDVLGYESIVSNWNAAEAIPWYLRDFSAKYRTIS